MRQLIRVLDPRFSLDEVSDEELAAELIDVLKRELDARKGEDLGQLIRRRLVEVTVGEFGLVETADLRSDLELATLLADFVLEEAGDAEGRAEFETFLRTKPRKERLDWLMASQRARALASDQAFDRAQARQKAESLQAGDTSGHEATATAILADLDELVKPKTGARKAAAEAAAAASAGGGALAAGGGHLAGTTSGAALGATGLAGAGAVAMPLAALAGGLYMAGKSRRQLTESAMKDAVKTRANRARRSRIVQNVVALSVFAVASAAADAR